ncbi:ribonuclease H-like domain-containing protein [Tanacetum coccineum]
MEQGYLSVKREKVGRDVKEKARFDGWLRLSKVGEHGNVASCRNDENLMMFVQQRGPTLIGNSLGLRIDVVVRGVYSSYNELISNTAYNLFWVEAVWHTLLFAFQFSSMDGLDALLENGSWFIRNHPLILKKWHPDKNLLKEDVSTVPVWVKLQGVPVTAFIEDGLSAIATKLGVEI